MTWTRDDIRRARQTPLPPVLAALGYQLMPLANDNFRLDGLPHEILVKRHYWVCPDPGLPGVPTNLSCGNAIDLLVRVLNMPFTEAVRILLANPP